MDYRMPLYIQIQDIIIKKIEERSFLPGEMIPSERKMAETYGVNRMTVKRAVGKLVEEGYLVRKPGSGTYVAKRDSKKIDYNDALQGSNVGITAMLKMMGVELTNQVLGSGEICGSRFLNYQLGLSEDQSVWGLHRVRLGDGSLFAVEYTYLPRHYFEDVEKMDFGKVSLYDYMDAKGHLPIHFTIRLIVCNASGKVAEHLQVKRGTAVYMLEYQGADKDYNIVEYTKSYMNPAFAEYRYNAEGK